MGYFLPPPDEPATGSIRGVAGIRSTPGAAEWMHEDEGGPGEGRLVRTVRMPLAEAAGYLARWQAERGSGATPLPAGPGVTARERRRPDRRLPGVVRRQRLAIGAAGDEATAVHWSAMEPLGQADEAAWSAALARLGPAPRPAPRGWTA